LWRFTQVVSIARHKVISPCLYANVFNLMSQQILQSPLPGIIRQRDTAETINVERDLPKPDDIKHLQRRGRKTRWTF